MSIYRHINGKNNDRDFLHKKKDYITDPLKTNGGKLVGSIGCIPEHDLDDWSSVKKVFHKSNGRQGEHSVLSLTKGKKLVTPEEAMIVMENLAIRLFYGHQVIYAVHTDTEYTHGHILANSVSSVNGKRYHIPNNRFVRIRTIVNEILGNYGFDPIVSRADEIVDNTQYDLSQGFECLEITDDKPYVNKFKNILAEPNDIYLDIIKLNCHVELYREYVSEDISPYSDVFTNNNFFKEDINMANSNYNQSNNTWRIPTKEEYEAVYGPGTYNPEKLIPVLGTVKPVNPKQVQSQVVNYNNNSAASNQGATQQRQCYAPAKTTSYDNNNPVTYTKLGQYYVPTRMLANNTTNTVSANQNSSQQSQYYAASKTTAYDNNNFVMSNQGTAQQAQYNLPAKTTANNNNSIVLKQGATLQAQYPIQDTPVTFTQSNNGYPNLHFHLSSPIKMKVPQSTSPEMLRDAIRASSPYNRHINPFEIGGELIKSFQDNNIQCNVSFDMFPSIDIEFTPNIIEEIPADLFVKLEEKPKCIYLPYRNCNPSSPYAACNSGINCERLKK